MSQALRVSGTPCKLSLDITADPRPPESLTFLKSEAGSWYLIEEAVKVRSTVHPNRWRFHCIRVEEPECFDPDDRVLVFYWYSRSRKR